jgi:hypothetical protein
MLSGAFLLRLVNPTLDAYEERRSHGPIYGRDDESLSLRGDTRMKISKTYASVARNNVASLRGSRAMADIAGVDPFRGFDIAGITLYPLVSRARAHRYMTFAIRELISVDCPRLPGQRLFLRHPINCDARARRLCSGFRNQRRIH